MNNLKQRQFHPQDDCNPKRSDSAQPTPIKKERNEANSTAAADPRSVLFFETTEEIFARVFQELSPGTPLPQFAVEYQPSARVHSSIQLVGGALKVKLSDVLQDAPALITESLARILLGKLFRKPAPRAYSNRYRLYLNRPDIRSRVTSARQERGWKYLSGPQGRFHNLEDLFRQLNAKYFGGKLKQPRLGWSFGRSRRLLGHYDPIHNAIVISRIFDERNVELLALEYVMFHEMLHLEYPVEHSGARRCVHTHAFLLAEEQFPGLAEAKEALKRLS